MLALGLIAACSGDDDEAADANGEAAAASSADASPSPTPTPTATATSTATATPPRTATATPIAATAAAAAAAIESPYERYHYLLTIALSIIDSSRGDTGPLLLGTLEGDSVAPDAHAFTSALEGGGFGLETSAVVIGDEAWLRDGATGPWEATSVAALRNDGTADQTSLDPGFLLYETEMEEVLAALRATDEVHAGIETIRYEVTPEAFEALAEVLSPDLLRGFDPSGIDGLAISVWVDPATSAVVAIEMRFLGTGLFPEAVEFGVPADAQLELVIEFEASPLNDPAIAIEPPL